MGVYFDEHVLEKGVPVPSPRKPPSRYPFSKMQVGDSFITRSGSVRGAMSAHTKRYPDHKFTARKVILTEREAEIVNRRLPSGAKPYEAGEQVYRVWRDSSAS